MPKAHPETVLLVESIRDMWRIVERKCTVKGLSPDAWHEVEGDIPTREMAKKRLRELKTAP